MSDLQHTVGLLGALGDTSRLRLLSLAEGEELSVAELTEITELPQSRVSTHLARLFDAGLLRRRRVGPSSLYTLNEAAMPEQARCLWHTIRERIDDGVLRSDLERRQAVIARREAAAAWPDTVAGQMERHYSPGRTWEATARVLVGLLRMGDVLDIGSGDGAIASLLAARCRSLTCLDRSEKVLAAARSRLEHLPNVAFELGDMHELPFADESFDQVSMCHVLTFSDDAPRALAQAHRVLRPDGDLILTTLAAHRHMDIAATYSHVNNGFAPDDLCRRLEAAEFVVSHCEVTSRERRRPHFEVVSAFARKPSAPASSSRVQS